MCRDLSYSFSSSSRSELLQMNCRVNIRNANDVIASAIPPSHPRISIHLCLRLPSCLVRCSRPNGPGRYARFGLCFRDYTIGFPLAGHSPDLAKLSHARTTGVERVEQGRAGAIGGGGRVSSGWGPGVTLASVLSGRSRRVGRNSVIELVGDPGRP